MINKITPQYTFVQQNNPPLLGGYFVGRLNSAEGSLGVYFVDRPLCGHFAYIVEPLGGEFGEINIFPDPAAHGYVFNSVICVTLDMQILGHCWRYMHWVFHIASRTSLR